MYVKEVTMSDYIWLVVVPALIVGLGKVVSDLLKLASVYINNQIEIQKGKLKSDTSVNVAVWGEKVTNRIAVEADNAINKVAQTYIKEIKKSRDPNSVGGSGLTKEEGLAALKMATSSVKDSLGAAFISEAESILGPGTIEEGIKVAIEAAVHRKDTPTGTSMKAIPAVKRPNPETSALEPTVFSEDDQAPPLK
jgi:hypothetical protein